MATVGDLGRCGIDSNRMFQMVARGANRWRRLNMQSQLAVGHTSRGQYSPPPRLYTLWPWRGQYSPPPRQQLGSGPRGRR